MKNRIISCLALLSFCAVIFTPLIASATDSGVGISKYELRRQADEKKYAESRKRLEEFNKRRDAVMKQNAARQAIKKQKSAITKQKVKAYFQGHPFRVYSFVKHSAVNMGMDFEKKGMDTLKLARNLLPDLESKSLQNLRQYYHLPQEEAHRALEDALTTFRLYERLREEFEEKNPQLFCPQELICKVKRQGPITPAQKRYLQDLVKYHRINLDTEPESLTKNEASRLIDTILGTYGKIVR